MTNTRCNFWANLALCLVLAALGVFALARVGTALGERGLFAGPGEIAPAMAEVLSHMQMEMVSMESAAGGEVRAGFVVYNGGTELVRDLELLCEFFDGQETYVGRQRWTLRQEVQPGVVNFVESSARFFVPRRAEGVQCQMVGLRQIPSSGGKVARAQGAEPHGEGQESDGKGK
ncbi:MAG: hypothetical protein BWK76_25335 [Desulfobulbaceae bacterium A2]|nr:MAG: hypothetical protein BWK76_25335 [Desulfobulbaceae bacterium A2]